MRLTKLQINTKDQLLETLDCLANNEKQNLGHHGKTVRYLFGVKAPRKLPVVASSTAPSVKA